MSSQLLKGKKGIISGALNNMSIAWKVAERAAEEGAQIILTNAPIAMRMGEINGLAEKINAPIIAADATSEADLENLFDKSMEHFGGKVDFVLHSIGMSPNVRKGRHYTDLNYEWYKQSLDVSAMSLHKLPRCPHARPWGNSATWTCACYASFGWWPIAAAWRQRS